MTPVADTNPYSYGVEYVVDPLSGYLDLGTFAAGQTAYLIVTMIAEVRGLGAEHEIAAMLNDPNGMGSNPIVSTVVGTPPQVPVPSLVLLLGGGLLCLGGMRRLGQRRAG